MAGLIDAGIDNAVPTLNHKQLLRARCCMPARSTNMQDYNNKQSPAQEPVSATKSAKGNP